MFEVDSSNCLRLNWQSMLETIMKRHTENCQHWILNDWCSCWSVRGDGFDWFRFGHLTDSQFILSDIAINIKCCEDIWSTMQQNSLTEDGQKRSGGLSDMCMRFIQRHGPMCKWPHNWIALSFISASRVLTAHFHIDRHRWNQSEQWSTSGLGCAFPADLLAIQPCELDWFSYNKSILEWRKTKRLHLRDERKAISKFSLWFGWYIKMCVSASCFQRDNLATPRREQTACTHTHGLDVDQFLRIHGHMFRNRISILSPWDGRKREKAPNTY